MPADTEALTGARRVARTVLALIAVAVMIGTGVAWGKIRSFENGIFHMSTAALGGGGQDGAIDILLVGMDSRTDAHGNPLSEDELAALHAGDDVSTNTDTIILVRIPNNGKSATAISIPRDSYVKAPGLDKTKINGVYGQVKLDKMKQLVEQQGMDPAEAEPKATEAGREALIKTVADLTGVTVDHYAEIGLLGFSLITDALGGVDVCLKDAVYEPLSGADFPAGWQKLDGPQALSFVRQRHDLPRGDLDRVVRQQVVMASLAHQVISGKTLTSPSTLNRLQDAIQRSVVLSSGWDIMDFIKQLETPRGWQRGVRDHPGARRGRLERRRHAVGGPGRSVSGAGLGGRPAARSGRGQDREDRLHAGTDQGRRGQRHRYQRPGRCGVRRAEHQGLWRGQYRQQRQGSRDPQPGAGRQG